MNSVDRLVYGVAVMLRSVATGGGGAAVRLGGAGVCRASAESAAWLSPRQNERAAPTHMQGSKRWGRSAGDQNRVLALVAHARSTRGGRASSGVQPSALGRVWARESSVGSVLPSDQKQPEPATRDLDIWEKLYAKDYEEKSRLAQFMASLTELAAVTTSTIPFPKLWWLRNDWGR